MRLRLIARALSAHHRCVLDDDSRLASCQTLALLASGTLELTSGTRSRDQPCCCSMSLKLITLVLSSLPP